MNVGDFGDRLVFGTGFGTGGFDMSSYTGLVLTFTKPDLTTLVVDTSNGVALGSGTYTLPSGQTFASHKYVTYTFIEGDIDVAGAWKVRLTYQQDNASPPISVTSNIANFAVGN